jgi:hypothetical protein
VLAFGPEMPGWGSWEWVGLDLQHELRHCYRTASFTLGAMPVADLVMVVKHLPEPAWIRHASARMQLIFAPVDFFGNAADVDAAGPLLRHFARIVVHCRRLERYFNPYAPVVYLDHHVKFVAPPPAMRRAEGYFLWIGVRTNLPPLIDWVNRHPLPGELVVLTNLENTQTVPSASALGFRPERPVRIVHWTAERHLELTANARAALDVKGDDFRSSHKPPAKAIDFLASGLPLAMNPESSSVEHLAAMGFDIPSPLDTDRWLSAEYWEETQRFGRALRELLSLPRIALRYRRVIGDVLATAGVCR